MGVPVLRETSMVSGPFPVLELAEAGDMPCAASSS